MGVQDIRAYKLGKKRWSYNQVELVLFEKDGDRHLTVRQAVHQGPAGGSDGQDSAGVNYEIILLNGERITLDAYLVYSEPQNVEDVEDGRHKWTLVDRCACQRNCSGPVLRAIQRFGKLGKRSWAGSPSPDFTDRTNHNMKDTRYLYLSFDEAVTHVGTKFFRLVVAVQDKHGAPLSTGASPPVRVLANNDVPTGAAHLQVLVEVPSSWEGWKNAPSHLGAESFLARLSSATDSPVRTSSKRKSITPTSIMMYTDTSSGSEGDPSNTPLRLTSSGMEASPSSSPYQTRRLSITKKAPVVSDVPEAPISPRHCLSTGNAQSSLLLEGGNRDQMTPAMEVASSPLQHREGSLAVWLGNVKVDDQGDDIIKVKGHHHHHLMAGPLPHSIDHEPNFPALLAGPSSNNSPRHTHHQHQLHGMVERHGLRVATAVPTSSTQTTDDPIAAFVELMMMQTQHHEAHSPVIELPQISHDDRHSPAADPSTLSGIVEKMVVCGDATSPLRTKLPGTPPSIATPTPSALDDIFGMHASTF